MTDIFREIEEDLRRDRAADFLRRYGSLLIAAAIVVVLGVAGWRYWSTVQASRAAEMGARFQDAVTLAREGKIADSEKALEAMAATAPGGYQMLSRFRLATEVAKRDPAAGIAAFEAIATDPKAGEVLQGFARIRAAMLQVDRVEPKELAAKIEGMTAVTNPWRNTARELLGLSALRAGDFEAAGRWFDQIIIDPEVSSALRQRAQLYLEIVRGGPVTIKLPLPGAATPTAPGTAGVAPAAPAGATTPGAAQTAPAAPIGKP